MCDNGADFARAAPVLQSRPSVPHDPAIGVSSVMECHGVSLSVSVMECHGRRQVRAVRGGPDDT